MNKILVLIGSNYLGHVTHIVEICNQFKKNGYKIQFVIMPLTSSDLLTPISVSYTRNKGYECEYIKTYALNKVIVSPVFNYTDLLFQLNFTNEDFVTSYYQCIAALIEKHTPKIIISDFVFFSNIVAQKMGISHITVRSHGMRVKANQEYFNWWSISDASLIRKQNLVLKCLRKLIGINNINDSLYANCVITPGFEPFDQVFPLNAKTHFFYVNKINELYTLPEKDIYIYIRNELVKNKIIKFIKSSKYSYLDINCISEDEYIDLWAGRPSAKLLISHGGHGMCTWAAINGIPHMVLSDNDDRMSNGLRVQELKLGLHFDLLSNTDYSIFQEINKTLHTNLEIKRYDILSTAFSSEHIVNKIIDQNER